MKTRSILKILMLIVLIDMTSISLAGEETWTRKTDMPTRRLGLSTSVVNGKIYAIGGGYSIEGPHSQIVEEYNPATDAWTRKANMPTGRIGHAASVVNGRIYVFGGDVRREVSGLEVEEYDPATDTWTQKADMPTKRTFLCACAVEGKIYAIGGITAPAMQTLSTVEVYNPATDTWTTKANMPTPRWVLSTCTVNGKIYAVGGRGNSILRTVEEYDPTTDTWTRKADMLTTRASLCTSVVSGRIYAIGGASGQTGPVLKTVEVYEPITDTWTVETDMPTPKWFFSTSAMNGKVYAIGGSIGYPPHSSVSMVEEYDTGLIPSQPDFNGDGQIDIKDLLRIVESWGQNDPIVDIAPPFGDGVVDALDLEILLRYWEQPVDDPTLVTHWALDEAEGTVAYDSVGMNDAYIIGELVWQPEGGKVGGALTFDGIDDYALSQYGLNPADGPFSVFAWIQGGLPGQVILSQMYTANWLCIDSLEGNLMTELQYLGRSGSPMISQTNITDGNWHRVGLVWDGLYRMLYVDDILVAEDAQKGLGSSVGGLNIGTGKAMEEGTYFAGMIDDVRVYNRVLIP